MTDLWGDWLYHLDGGGSYTRAPCVSSEVSAVMKWLDVASYVAFMPMMTELRGELSNDVYVPIKDFSTMYGPGVNIDHDTNLRWAYQDPWLKQCQIAQYAEDCLSGNLDFMQTALLENIQIWKGVLPSSDPNCPMNSQYIPQATHLSSLYTELSSLEGTKQHPWWTSRPYGSGDYDWTRYTTYVGPYVPSHMDRQWYNALWKAVAKLANTPTIYIGKGSGDWRWLNPLWNPNGSPYFSIDDILHTQFGWWREIDDTFVPELDEAICGSQSPALYNMPWSVCGLYIGSLLYTSDASGQMTSEYKNLPILEPLDGMRSFFGATTTFAHDYSGRGDLRYKYNDEMFSFYSVPYSYRDILSVGADIDFPYNYDKPFSFVSKSGRTSSGELQETKLQNDLPDNISTPPIRLGSGNVLANLWCWETLVDGRNASNHDSHTGLAYAWTPFTFWRKHFYRHYEFYVGGEAHLSSDGTSWMMVINQSEHEDSWSNFQWRPVSELSPHEPIMANVGSNTLKWQNNSSYGSNVPENIYPSGHSAIHCVFEIPLPLSIDGDTAVFDATWLSTSGYTRAEWNEIVRIARSMFPRTAGDKIEELLAELSAEYLDPNTGLIPTAERYLSGWQDELTAYQKLEADVSADTWKTVWGTVVNQVWDEDTSWYGKFTDGISATSAWTGTDPDPFENYLSLWNNSYYFNNGYYNTPLSSVSCDFDGGYPGYGPWADDLAWIFNNWYDDIADSKVYKDGSYVSAYYSAQQLEACHQALSAIQEDLKQNGSSALAGAGVDIQTANAQWLPLDCYITTDPQTGTETSSYDVDDNRWKQVVISMNQHLETYAQRWYDESRYALNNAFDAYPMYAELSDKWDYIDGISAVLDSTMIQAWQNEYGIALPYEEAYILNQIAYINGEIQYLSGEIDRLSAEYDAEYQRILDETTDDPLPDPRDLKKFLHYDLSSHADNLSTDWSASLNLLAVAPDTWEEPLSAYPPGYSKYDEQHYYCDEPKSRWPAHVWPMWYMVPAMKTTLEEVTISGETQLSNIVRGTMFGGYFTGYGGWQQKPFDEFRDAICDCAERDQPYDYFGQEWPRPTQLFGSQVNNPGRWNISAELSVDIGDISQGIEKIEYDQYNMNVRFNYEYGSDKWEARNIWIWCLNGPVVYTDDCWWLAKKRWENDTTYSWRLAEGEAAKAEYYGKEPEAGVDYSLPELSGHLEVKFGHQVIGALDMPTVYSSF